MTSEIVPAPPRTSAPRSFPPSAELNSMWKVASTLAGTEFVPGALRNRPDAVMACVLYGREIGIGPMQALQQISVIDGKPTVAPELMRSLVRRGGHTIEVVERDDTRCTLRGTRADDGTEETVTWTTEHAERAGLCRIHNGKIVARSQKDKPLPWETYTRAMLLARCTAELCRSLFADVIVGVSYTPEEMHAVAQDPIPVAPLALADDESPDSPAPQSALALDVEPIDDGFTEGWATTGTPNPSRQTDAEAQPRAVLVSS